MKNGTIKTKSYGTQTSDDVLAYRLLKSANLSTRDEQLVKATITELKYDSVKNKLIKIFSDNNDIPTSDFNNMHIKTEPVYSIIPNHIQKVIHLTKLILTVKTLNTKPIT